MGLAAAQIVFAALGAVQTALLSRQLRFDLLTKAGIFASLVSGAAGIAAALQGAGVWSLVIQLAVLAAMNSLALWVVSPWRPAFTFRMRDLGGLFRFGFALSLSSALDVIYTQGFALIVGKLHGVRDVGLYNRAQSTQLLPSNVIGSIVGRVAMPVFAGRSDDRGALRRGMRLANGLTMLVNVPVMTGLILLSDLVVRVLFGDQWPAAAPILSILALAGIVYPLHIINLQTLLAQGRSDLFLRLEIIKKTVGIGSIIIGSLFGLIGLAWSQVAFACIGLAINAWPTKKSLDYGALRQLRDLGGIFIAAAIMAAALLIVRPLLHGGPLVELLILTAVGAATYVAAGTAINGPDFRQAFDLAGQTLGRIANRRSRDVAG
jgi:O-antigen/teichoic acid export membrane protein